MKTQDQNQAYMVKGVHSWLSLELQMYRLWIFKKCNLKASTFKQNEYKDYAYT